MKYLKTYQESYYQIFESFNKKIAFVFHNKKQLKKICEFLEPYNYYFSVKPFNDKKPLQLTPLKWIKHNYDNVDTIHKGVIYVKNIKRLGKDRFDTFHNNIEELTNRRTSFEIFNLNDIPKEFSIELYINTKNLDLY